MSLLLGATKIDAVYLGQPATNFTPVEARIETVGNWTYTIPAGATRMDVVIFGGGGGGGSSGALGDGDGGAAGSSRSKTYIIGTDFPAGGTVTGYNGPGGAGKSGGFSDAQPGAASTFGTLTANGGAGGSGLGDPHGGSAAPVTLNGRVYQGGAGAANAPGDGANGAVGGGGGGGGAQSSLGNNGGSGGSGLTYLYFYAEASGTGIAQAVYLGPEKVWPSYVGNLSQWYNPVNNNGQWITAVPWPAGAEFCDVIMIGGGAGGTGTGIGGNPQLGGGAGQWKGATIPRVEAGITYVCVKLQWVIQSGMDGVGGGNFNTEAADGTVLKCWGSEVTSWGGSGPAVSTAQALDKTSATGNRNGGTVAPSFTFNGRTYTVASYGAGAGAGGATSNKNGGPGSAPGGGGQSADNGGLTGYSGGNGAQGAAILYWY